MIFRNCCSASSMPAAVQRSAISPEDQRLTLRWVRRTISIIDSHGLVLFECALQVAADAEAGERQRFFDSFAQRAGGAGVGAVELGGESAELVERAAVILERPRPAQPLLHVRPVALGQMLGHVAFLVPQTALHGRLAEDVADRLA